MCHVMSHPVQLLVLSVKPNYCVMDHTGPLTVYMGRTKELGGHTEQFPVHMGHTEQYTMNMGHTVQFGVHMGCTQNEHVQMGHTGQITVYIGLTKQFTVHVGRTDQFTVHMDQTQEFVRTVAGGGSGVTWGWGCVGARTVQI